MTQSELEISVSRATGESLCEIRSRGFSLADPEDVNFDPEPRDLSPQWIDWDDLHAVDAPRSLRRRRKLAVA